MELVHKLQRYTINIDDNKINVNEKSARQHRKEESNVYRPPATNSLLWCMMSLIDGVEKCRDNMSVQFKYETEFKYKQIQSLRDSSYEIKCEGMDPLVIETEFIGEKYMSFDSFRALCIAHKLSVIYINHNTYIRIIHEDAPINIISKGQKYTIEYNVSQEKIDSACKFKYQITNVKKPIKGVGSYTVVELRTICDTLGIITYVDKKNKTKPVLYKEICSFIGL